MEGEGKREIRDGEESVRMRAVLTVLYAQHHVTEVVVCPVLGQGRV